MNTILIILVVGAFIASFLHCTRGTIHNYEKIFGGPYTILFVILAIYSWIKYGFKQFLIVFVVFYGSNLIFSIILELIFRKKIR